MKYILLLIIVLFTNACAEPTKTNIPRTVFDGIKYTGMVNELPLKVPRTVEEFRELEKQAQNGSVDAYFLLGKLYTDNSLKESERDYQKAIEYYSKALKLDKNHAESLYNLGIIYSFGYGVQEDQIKANDLLQRAGDSGIINGYQIIGVNYLHGLGNSPQDLEKAFHYIKINAEKGTVEKEISQEIINHWDEFLILMRYKPIPSVEKSN
ncbi:tetratricopeptide repeat protein [Photorhabdus caribbeanensis]|uniref:tetratricopeptide repeat protein n=1 Tax=Photorhabdus caribbeanensis TaxID=1004165 RepID=UPI001BD1E7BB|nr:tetratricopeptide repeat protein [Photorhabdus caribbeanensis]MBS9422330.1 sel1 repeat family protein [Photorhabdus caribbeanensis]